MKRINNPLKKIRKTDSEEKARSIISANISEMINEGYPQRQAVAASLESARKDRPILMRRMYGKSPSKNPISNSAKAASMIKQCHRLWEYYCKKPSKARLQKLVDHCENMKNSKMKTVKYERAKCMRAVIKEKNILKMK